MNIKSVSVADVSLPHLTVTDSQWMSSASVSSNGSDALFIGFFIADSHRFSHSIIAILHVFIDRRWLC